MAPDQWSADLQKINYDQAWSMVHFLINADGGKYQSGFVNFMTQIGQGQAWPQAWQHNFANTAAFEAEWKNWWLSQNEDPTSNLYVQATCQTLTSYLAACRVSPPDIRFLRRFPPRRPVRRTQGPRPE